MIKHQVIAILKMRIAKILLLLLITLNLISFISLNNQKTDFENDVNNKVQETIEYSTYSEPHRPALRATHSII